MTKTEFKRAVREANKIYAWCRLYEDEGEYIQVVKSNVMLIANQSAHTHCTDNAFDAVLRNDGDLYIN